MSARELIRTAVITLVRDQGGKMVSRPLFPAAPDMDATITEPESLAAVRAARHLEWAAAQAVRRYAHDAREDGYGWAEIGTALGYQPGEDMPPVSESAFRAVASDLGRGPSFAWTCPACRETVIDRGPETGHPEEQEQGHADGCARLAEAVRAWDAQWEEEDG